MSNDLDADGDALTAVLVDQPQHGTLQWAADGSFVYVPAAGYTGPDEFTYRATDGLADTIAVVSIRVGGENVRPTATNDVYRLDAGGQITIDNEDGVLANDSDANDDPLSAILYRGPQHGTLTLNSDGSFQYTPAAGFSGLDSFLYRASDSNLKSRLAVVSLRVQAVESVSANLATAKASNINGLTPVRGNQLSSAKAHDAVLSTMELENLLLTEFDDLLAT